MIEIQKPVFNLYNNFAKSIYPNIPYTYYWKLQQVVGSEGDSLIDFGCGWGDPVDVLQSKKRRYAVGVDVYDKYLKIVKKKGIYDKLIHKDITKYKSKKKFDLVTCFHVLEHLKMKQGEKMLKYFESIAKEKVVVAMPVGDLPQEEYDENHYQTHLSAWFPKYLKKSGYKVYGFNPKFLYGDDNIIKKLGFLGFFVFFISYLLEPYYLNKPEKCVYMLAVKDTSK